jgi:ATP-binding cassette subfamily B protein/subfamily B ATP-binding cassette protein MsbA
LDLAAFGQGRDSELLSRFTNDMTTLGSSLNLLFGRALREPLKMAVCLIIASTISWQLLVLSFLVVPPALLLMRRLASSIKRANRRAMEEIAQLYNTLSESFRGIQTVKAFTMEPYERNRFHQSAKQLFQKSMRIAMYNALTKPLTEILGVGVISLALIAGAYMVLEPTTHIFGIKMCDRPLELGKLFLFYGMLIGVTDPIRKMSDVLGAVQGGVAAADRIFSLMDRKSEITDPARPKTLPRPHQRIVFDRVDFHYESNLPVLHDIQLEIKFGETIAVVGPNGCGKSTLVNLIPRFFDPKAGSIRISEIDLRDLRRRDLRQRIGIVSQQTYLFDDTVMNNIRYGSPHASDEAVIEAACQAHADRFIMEKLSDGYDTMVGSGGGRLSGGQRQRISLARAILRDPEILILDEATSQIDIESEQLIHQALRSFVTNRTAIMVTHRMSTLTLADRVVVMEAGRIVDIGRHDELLTRCALYARLHDIHFQKTG